MNLLRDFNHTQSEQSSPVLKVTSVSKQYALYKSPLHVLTRSLFGSLVREPPSYSALRGVSFDLMPGDALAVIGRNGAGKSTLLQILSGVLEPTSGTVAVSGRVAGLLELGSGFNPEFSGRENVFINGAILGLSERQIRGRIAEIVEFADIGDYIDQPVKTYSSGMFLRLAFSVAIHAEPDVLLVDEALTVGDVFFQQKCYTRLKELRQNGMTVLLVTHSMADAAEFCNRGIVLSRGSVVFEGLGKEAVEYYFHHEHETPTGRQKREPVDAATESVGNAVALAMESVDSADPFVPNQSGVIDFEGAKQFGATSARALRALITDRDNKPKRVFGQGDWLRIYVDYKIDESLEVPVAGVQLINSKGVLVHGRNSLQFLGAPPSVEHGSAIVRCFQEIKLDIDVGEYTLDAGLAELPELVFGRRQRYSPSEIAPQMRLLCHVTGFAAISIIYQQESTPCLFSHYGVADLPGSQTVTVIPLSKS